MACLYQQVGGVYMALRCNYCSQGKALLGAVGQAVDPKLTTLRSAPVPGARDVCRAAHCR